MSHQFPAGFNIKNVIPGSAKHIWIYDLSICEAVFGGIDDIDSLR